MKHLPIRSSLLLVSKFTQTTSYRIDCKKMLVKLDLAILSLIY